MKEKLEWEGLAHYLPSNALPHILPHLLSNKVGLTLSLPRKSILGNYHAPSPGKAHKITINQNLNPYAFCITLMHEIAHLYTHKNFGNKAMPHGVEWKTTFKNVMHPVIQNVPIPTPVLYELEKYLGSPKASHCSSTGLVRALAQFDNINDGTVFLSDLPHGAIFKYENQIFKKGALRRTRYECPMAIGTKIYLFSKVARVLAQ